MYIFDIKKKEKISSRTTAKKGPIEKKSENIHYIEIRKTLIFFTGLSQN